MTRRHLISASSLLALILFICPAFGASSGINNNVLGHQTPAPTGRIIIKFAEESGLSVENGSLNRSAPDAGRIGDLLGAFAPGFRLTRHFSQDAAVIDAERRSGEGRIGVRLPNLNRYARLEPLLPVSRADLLGILKLLWADPAVETAFLEPVAVPAALGFDAFIADPAGGYHPGRPRSDDAGIPPRSNAFPRGGALLPTPDYTDLQGYLDPAPDGVDAEGVWANPGGLGQTVKVLDIEGAWLWDHEDLPAPFFTAGGEIDNESWRNHGTAVAGEIRGISNSYGVTGISYDVAIGGVSISELSIADAINTAAANLDEGDIFLIELHAPGPNATGEGQFGYVCMEFWQDTFDAILIATANGRICCEAAGNGQQDFDDPVYMGLFDRNVRDSGAIICGASNGGSLEPAGFTNYGTRVDLHGWGYSVCTAGYGNLQDGDETEWYTDTFSGTSSASPIVVGSVASLQGMVKAAYGIPMNARLARDILVATGTPQEGTNQIGPRPNLVAAWIEAQNGIGAVAGIVTDAGSGLPVPDVTVTAMDTGAFAVTGADGGYSMPFQAGSYTLLFTSFFYTSTTEPVLITSGNTATLDVVLTAAPTQEIGGVVYGDDAHTELENVRVTPIDVPIAGTVTGADGTWSIPGFPEGHSYIFIFDNLPGYGVDAYWVGGPSLTTAFAPGLIPISSPGLSRADVEFPVQLPTVTEDFDGGDGGYIGDLIWEYGTPLAGGPSSGFGGPNCWGVGMTGDYEDDVFGVLASPLYDFSGETELRLSFHYWCETESGFDGANVQIFDIESIEWVTLTPSNGYPSVILSGVNHEPGWSGSTGGWTGTVFDLSAYISSAVMFRIPFGSDGGVTGPGFWIDEICFDTGDVVSSVPADELAASAGILGVAPHPFRPQGTIYLAQPRDGEAQVAIYDLSGRLIRNLLNGLLPAGPTRLKWDGLDEQGHPAAGGVYFVRLATDGRIWSRRIILFR